MATGSTIPRILLLLIIIMITLFPLAGCQLRATVATSRGMPENGTASPQPPLASLHLLSETTGWALSYQTVLRTLDGGQTWTDVTPPGGRQADRSMAGEFLDATTAWVAVINDSGPRLSVFRTADGGETWRGVEVERKASGHIFGVSLDFVDSQRGWLMIEPEHGMSSRPGELYRTTDGGERWSLVARSVPLGPSPENGLPFYGPFAFRNALTGWVGGGRGAAFHPDHPLYLTRDGGQTWQAQNLELPAGYSQGELDVAVPPTFFPPQYEDGVLPVIFMPGSHQDQELATVIYVTHDGGERWRSAKPLRGAGIVNFADADHGWIWIAEPRDYGARTPVRGKLSRTRDGGQTWTIINPDRTLRELLSRGDNIVELNFVSKRVGWAVLRGPDVNKPLSQRATTLLKTVDGGYTWTCIHPSS